MTQSREKLRQIDECIILAWLHFTLYWVFADLQRKKNVVETIFTQNLQVNFINNYKEMASNTLNFDILKTEIVFSC